MTVLAELRAVARRLDRLEERLGPSVPAEGDRAAVLRAEAEALGVAVVLGGYVAEAGAARLLGRSPACLKAWRQNGRAIARPQKLLGKWHYELAELSEIRPESLEENEW